MKYIYIITFMLISANLNSQSIPHINSILDQLNLKISECKIDLIVYKTNPINKNQTIIVIPEIEKKDKDYFELNTYILIVNSNTGEILSKYFESSATNGWISDAVRLAEIKIDTAPYLVLDKKRAFGVRVYYYNTSHPNPYSSESLSLFLKDGSNIKQILKNFEVMNSGGEIDSDCIANLSSTQKILILDKNKTNGFYNISVKSTSKLVTRNESSNGDCVEDEKIIHGKQILKFINGMYQ